MNNVPLIGQKPEEQAQPQNRALIEISSSSVQLSAIIPVAKYSPAELGQLIVNLGNALDTMVPGATDQLLEHWAAQRKVDKRNGQAVLQSVGIAAMDG